MRAAFEFVAPTSSLSWTIERLRVPRVESLWHYHSEFELTFICEGAGTRLIGESAEEYRAGDLVLIGPEVPHIYVSNPGEPMHEAVIVQFRRDFLGEGFFDNPSFSDVASLLDRASRGLAFDSREVTLESLDTLGPASSTVELLRILVDLCTLPAHELGSSEESPALSRASAARIEAMVQMMHAAYFQSLSLASIAGAAHMSASSASRLFRRSTGKTITRYLNEVRVTSACRLLRDTDLSVADIAAECGFGNLSNFNRRFREIKNAAPRDYRRSFALR